MKKDYRSGSDLTRFRAFCYSLECYVGTSTFNTLTFELYHSQKANRDTYSKPPWALRVPMKAEDRYPYVLFSLISRAQILCLLFQMRQHII